MVSDIFAIHLDIAEYTLIVLAWWWWYNVKTLSTDRL